MSTQPKHTPNPLCGMQHDADQQSRISALESQNADLVKVLKGIYAALNQPVQFSDSGTPSAAKILRGDAQTARDMAEAALARAKEVAL